MIWLLLACGRGEDSAGKDSTPEAESGLGAAPVAIYGPESSAAGVVSAADADVNGDGYDDVLVSAYAVGVTCIFEGPIAAGDHPMEDGLCLTEEVDYDFGGFGAAFAGDTDGDGQSEVIIGAIGNDEVAADAGKVYLIAAGDSSLADAPYQWTGEVEGDYAGSWVASAGDTNGDGLADLLVGATGSDEGGSGGGKAYLISSPFTPGVGTLTDATGFVGAGTSRHATSAAGDGVGYAVVSAGDVNGDGLADVLVGAAGNDEPDTDVGRVAVFLGPVDPGSQPIALADAMFIGAAAGGFAGDRLAGGRDANGDGVADVLIAADGELSAAGKVYLWLGPISSGANLSLSAAPVAFTGEYPDDQAGYSIAMTPDSNGDGKADVLIGAWSSDRPGVDGGAVYLCQSPFSGTLGLEDAPILLAGEAAGDYAGRSASAGDVDGNGVADLLVGAPYNTEYGPVSGKTYLIYY